MNTIFSGGTVRGNQCFNNNFVGNLDDYTKEEQEALLRGEEIPSQYDDDGNVIEWTYICEGFTVDYAKEAK